MAANDINCEEALKRLFEFIDHELADDDRDGLERHLRACRSCFSRVEFELQLKDKLRALVPDDPPHTLHHRIKTLIDSF